MTSRAWEITRRAWPLVSYAARGAGDDRLTPEERGLLHTMGAEILAVVDQTIAALVPEEERDGRVVRDLERCRRRLRAAVDGLAEEVAHVGA